MSVRAAAEPLAAGTPVPGTANPGYYSFDQQQTYWSVVGLRSASDYDLTLYSDAGYSGWLTGSSERGTAVDFIAVDHNRAGTGAYYPKVDRFTGTNAYTIEWDGGPDALTPGVPVNVGWDDSSVVKVWDIELPKGIAYQVSVKVVSGTANVGIALVTSNGAYPYYSSNHVPRNYAVGSADANSGGSGSVPRIPQTRQRIDELADAAGEGRQVERRRGGGARAGRIRDGHNGSHKIGAP